MLKSCKDSFLPQNTAQGAKCYMVTLDLVLAPGLSCPICEMGYVPLCLDPSGKMEIQRVWRGLCGWWLEPGSGAGFESSLSASCWCMSWTRGVISLSRRALICEMRQATGLLPSSGVKLWDSACAELSTWQALMRLNNNDEDSNWCWFLHFSPPQVSHLHVKIQRDGAS